jgi:hypothetical protein
MIIDADGMELWAQKVLRALSFFAFVQTLYCVLKELYFNRLTGFLLWRQYWRHFLGYIFYGGVSPSIIGPIALS